MKLKTWHIEHIAITAILAIVWIATGYQKRELIGAVVVHLGYWIALIGEPKAECKALRDKPSVACFRQYWVYYVAKEIAGIGYLVYFVLSGAWSAVVGCVLFGLYPVCRKWWRKSNPTECEMSACSDALEDQ